MSTKSVQDIYDQYIASIDADHISARYVGNEHWYHSSGSGLCMRKHFFSSIEKVKGNKRNADTYRLFRLGTIVHEDIQTSISLYAQQQGIPVFIEKELHLDDLGVRGFIDLAFVEDKVLYDIKTCNSWKWRTMFGRDGSTDAAENYMLQLGTYGLWFKREYGDLKGLKLTFYNKDTSKMRDMDVDISAIERAEDYWNDVNMHIENGCPPIAMKSSPVYDWECNPKYCEYFEHCGGGIKPSLLKEK